jgi:hypothetical protein
MRTPARIAAIKFRIWQYAQPKGWDTTVPEVAEALDLPAAVVGQVVRCAGWRERFRVNMNRVSIRQSSTVCLIGEEFREAFDSVMKGVDLVPEIE